MEKALLIFIKQKYPAENSRNIKEKLLLNNHFKENIKLHPDEEIKELENLALSAGAVVESTVLHNQDAINSKYYISSGKLQEIKNITSLKNLNLVIFDNELTPAQQSNLENIFGIKVIDRTALILDIFAQRAHSSEGKLQVELAQLNYILPRLRGKGTELSRLGGGIGTRGPGEQKLEVDRRKIRKRIKQLESRIEQIAVQRQTQRKMRQEKNIYQISLVGYTNSGKSTLLNTLTKSNVMVKDMLFSTLDSTTRKIKIPEIDEILISDTVGFIEKLPHQLVASFKSTLEEVKKSNLLLMIVDAGNINFEYHIKSVMNVLKEIEVSHKQIIIVFNKIDTVNAGELKKIKLKYKNAVYISALEKKGLSKLYEKLKDAVDKERLEVRVRIPYTETKLMSFIYNNAKILEKKYDDKSAILLINISPSFHGRISQYIFRGKRTIKI